MRHSNLNAGGATVQRVPLWRRVLVPVLVAVLGGWAVYSFAQELYLEHQLGAQAAQLDRQNRSLAEQNDGYRRDAMALESGAAAEEDARRNGYARPDEKVYLVGTPPTPSPAPAAKKAAASSSTPSFWSWLAAFFHR